MLQDIGDCSGALLIKLQIFLALILVWTKLTLIKFESWLIHICFGSLTFRLIQIVFFFKIMKLCFYLKSSTRFSRSLSTSSQILESFKSKSVPIPSFNKSLHRFFDSKKLQWVLTGIVSFGQKKCGVEGFPAVYTNVSESNSFKI